MTSGAAGPSAVPTARVSRTGSVATLAMNTVDDRMPLSVEGVADLSAALDDVFDDRHPLRALVITGTGKTFATGADLAAISTQGTAENAAYNRSLIDSFERINSADVPVIAAINGLALGGGLELALAADLRVASDQARLGLPEVRLGLIPGAGGTQRLPRLIGEAAALDLLLTGRTIDADEALRLGLVNRVVPGPDLLDATSRLAEQLADNAPLAQAVIKQQVRTGRALDVRDAIDTTHRALGPLLESRDLGEGIAAFLAKRPAKFIGR